MPRNKGVKLRKDDRVVDALLVPASAVEDEAEAEEEDVSIDDGAVLDIQVDENGEPIEVEETYGELLLTVTANGYGKRTPFDKYPVQGRNGMGVISHKTGDDVGLVVGARVVTDEDQLMIVTDTGRVIRISAKSIRVVQSRSSKGVRLMRLGADERIVDIARLEEDDEEPVDADDAGEGTSDDSASDEE